MNSRRTILFVSTILVAASAAAAFVVWPRAAMTQQGQSPQKQQTPTIDEYQPKSTLVTKEHKIERAKFPFIDIHSHHWNPTAEEVDRLVRERDTINLRVMVNLSGGTGEQLKNTLPVARSSLKRTLSPIREILSDLQCRFGWAQPRDSKWRVYGLLFH